MATLRCSFDFVDDAAIPGVCLRDRQSIDGGMTITNDATSTAANRILTLTGADVALTGTSMAEFQYSAVSSRWILLGTQG